MWMCDISEASWDHLLWKPVRSADLTRGWSDSREMVKTCGSFIAGGREVFYHFNFNLYLCVCPWWSIADIYACNCFLFCPLERRLFVPTLFLRYKDTGGRVFSGVNQAVLEAEGHSLSRRCTRCLLTDKLIQKFKFSHCAIVPNAKWLKVFKVG